MKRFACLIVVVITAATAALNAGVGKPAVSVEASVVTQSGGERVFVTPKGSVGWTPSLPVQQGDRLTVTFLPSDGYIPSRVSVRLDDRSLADIRTAPWKVVIDTKNLSPGKHVVKADVRFSGTPRTYSITEYVFYVQDASTRVKGMVQEVGGPTTGSGPVIQNRQSRPFYPPTESLIKQDIRVDLRSLDPEIDTILGKADSIRVTSPVTFRLDARPGVDRWAYMIKRDGRQIAGAGPVARSIYLEVAPKSAGGDGLFSGEVELYAWGVRNDGSYSPAVVVPLVIE